jgi:hypothetical protein
MNLAFNNLPSYTIPTKLNNSSNRFQHNINIEEVCNGVAHPITKEMVTKYMKLMDDPALKGLWISAMSKELHCCAQGKECVTVGTIPFSILHMMISGASQKIIPPHTKESSSTWTTAPRKTTQIECTSPLAVTSSIICTNSLHVQPTWSLCKNNVEQCHQYPRSHIWQRGHLKHVSQNPI